jgi:hypothetical protein
MDTNLGNSEIIYGLVSGGAAALIFGSFFYFIVQTSKRERINMNLAADYIFMKDKDLLLLGAIMLFYATETAGASLANNASEQHANIVIRFFQHLSISVSGFLASKWLFGYLFEVFKFGGILFGDYVIKDKKGEASGTLVWSSYNIVKYFFHIIATGILFCVAFYMPYMNFALVAAALGKNEYVNVLIYEWTFVDSNKIAAYCTSHGIIPNKDLMAQAGALFQTIYCVTIVHYFLLLVSGIMAVENIDILGKKGSLALWIDSRIWGIPKNSSDKKGKSKEPEEKEAEEEDEEDDEKEGSSLGKPEETPKGGEEVSKEQEFLPLKKALEAVFERKKWKDDDASAKLVERIYNLERERDAGGSSRIELSNIVSNWITIIVEQVGEMLVNGKIDPSMETVAKSLQMDIIKQCRTSIAAGGFGLESTIRSYFNLSEFDSGVF